MRPTSTQQRGSGFLPAFDKRKILLGALGFFAGTTLTAQTTFSYTGGVQTYTVPVGVTLIQAEVWGAQGESAGSSSGGLGGYVKANLVVTPGQVLNIYVGGQTGYNGGGTDGGGSGYPSGKGGGATDIRVGGTTLTDRVLVGGGGGGAGRASCTNQHGGGGGYPGGLGGTGDGAVGGDGGINGGSVAGGGGCGSCCSSSRGGGGGGQEGGGAQGGYGNATGGSGGACGGLNSDYSGGCGNVTAGGGCFGLGGNGIFPGCNGGGGGGGGGWYGGGSGGANWGSGGGGGSSYYAPSLTGTATTNAVRSGNGQAVITVLPGGTSLNFDGANDVVTLGSALNALLDPINTFTVEAWVNPSDTDPFGCIVGNYQTASPGMQFLLRRDAATYTFFVDAGAGLQTVSTGNVVSTGTWQHVAGVWDGSSLMIYLDGVLQATTSGVTGSSFVSSTNPVFIGNNSIAEGFTGNIDEVRIWSIARNRCEIAGSMNCELGTVTGLLANYHFNQGLNNGDNTGITTLYEAGSTYNGTLNHFTLNGASSNWAASEVVVSGDLCAPLLFPEINVRGNNLSIAHGDITPDVADFTDLGTMSVCNGTISKSFRIENTGTAPLSISSVVLSGTHAGDYAVALAPAPLVAAGDTTNFIITFNPSAAGTRMATVSITNGDCNGEDPYQFDLQGTGSQITASVLSQADVLCFGDSNGSATAGSTGGVGTIAYDWSPSGGSAATATGLAAGTYTCTATDFYSCTATVTITIGEPALLTASASATDALCFSGADGTATVIANGGTGAYAYNWSPTGGSAATIAGLTAGTYTCVVTDVNGCTNGASATVNEPAAITSTQNPTICAGESFTVGTSVYNVPGTYTDVLLTGLGCDSTVTTNLTVNSVDVSTSTSGLTITANAAGAGTSYQWINCGTGNLPIGGETNASYTATANGAYAVIVTENACSDTSTCENILSVGINSLHPDQAFVVYPNPFTQQFTIVNPGDSKEVQISISNTLGQVVYTSTFSSKQTMVDLAGSPAGTYVLKITSGNQISTHQLIKE